MFCQKGNHIERLEPMIFKEQQMLQILSLKANLISQIDDERTFSHLINLQTLDLSDNKLILIDAFIFQNLDKLKYLRLEGNLLKKIDAFKLVDDHLGELGSLKIKS